MDAIYETVVDPASLMTSGIPLVLHTAVFAAEVAVASFVGIQGLLWLLSRDGAVGEGAEGWGFVATSAGRRRGAGGACLAAGLCLLAPAAIGAHESFAIVGWAACAGLVLAMRRRAARARVPHGLVLASLVLVGGFALYEGRDPARQLRDVATKAFDWRQHELDWQLDHDRRSPKIGDLAPDFELADTTGANSVRLATFRGKRPVALVFGSYT